MSQPTANRVPPEGKSTPASVGLASPLHNKTPPGVGLANDQTPLSPALLILANPSTQPPSIISKVRQLLIQEAGRAIKNHRFSPLSVLFI